jgi:ATP-dependent DNA ligase
LLFHRGTPCFFAFDILFCDGKDWRREALMDRKQELRRLLSKVPADLRLKYVDHVAGTGTALFQQVWKLDSEGVVAKRKSGRYVTERETSSWFKIRNRQYSQMAGRAELFEPERHQEPVPGWHSCVLACAEEAS